MSEVKGRDVTAAATEKFSTLLQKLPLHKPGENYTMEGYPKSEIAMKMLEQHARRTNKMVFSDDKWFGSIKMSLF